MHVFIYINSVRYFLSGPQVAELQMLKFPGRKATLVTKMYPQLR